MRIFDLDRVMTPLGPAMRVDGFRWNTAGLAPPPPYMVERQEAMAIKRLQMSRNPYSDEMARFLDERGDRELWFDFAKQYRWGAGFVRGWLGTGLMGAAMGVAALRSWFAKQTYQRARPYQVDPHVQRVVEAQDTNPSYPSGHATASAAAATVLGMLWPLRAAEFQFWADQVAHSRVYGGVHYPSDVIAGQRLGQQTGLMMSGFIRS